MSIKVSEQGEDVTENPLFFSWLVRHRIRAMEEADPEQRISEPLSTLGTTRDEHPTPVVQCPRSLGDSERRES